MGNLYCFVIIVDLLLWKDQIISYIMTNIHFGSRKATVLATVYRRTESTSRVNNKNLANKILLLNFSTEIFYYELTKDM